MVPSGCVLISSFHLKKLFWDKIIKKLEITCVVDGSFKIINQPSCIAGMGGYIMDSSCCRNFFFSGPVFANKALDADVTATEFCWIY